MWENMNSDFFSFNPKHFPILNVISIGTKDLRPEPNVLISLRFKICKRNENGRPYVYEA